MTRDELLAAVEAQAAQFDQGRLSAAQLRSWLHALQTDDPDSLQRLIAALDSDDGKDRLGPNGWLAVRGILDDLHVESGGLADSDALPAESSADATARPAVEAALPPLRDRRGIPDWDATAALPARPLADARRQTATRHRYTRAAEVGVVLLSVFSVLGLSAVAALALSPGLRHRVPFEAPAWVPQEWMIGWTDEDRAETGSSDSASAESLTTRVQRRVPEPELELELELETEPELEQVREPMLAPASQDQPEPGTSREGAPDALATVQALDQRALPDEPSQGPASVPTRFSFASSQLRVSGAEPAILLPVIREGALAAEARLRFQILPGSARPEEDYVPSSDSSVRFAAGEERALIIVPLYRGGEPRGERSLRVRLLVDDPAAAGDVTDVQITLAGSD